MNSSSASRIDPVTLEILSNRLWITNDEVAATVRRVSGSPVATEICDFNTALMLANGDAFMVGMYMGLISLGHDSITKDILREYSENPGIEPDDMFICADPYLGSLHQNDVALVAPVYWDGRLIAWSGVAIHEVDVGGLVHGSHGSIGATSIYQEALPMPPMRIIEGGRLRKDIEREYLIRSRTRDLNALDLRAKIAANNLAKDRILECVRRYGVETVVAAMDAIVDSSEEKLRRRLRRIADGTWRHRAYMDGLPGTMYEIVLEMTKTGGRLVFDFTGTDEQAPAVFNCSKVCTMGGVVAAILPMLCYGMYSCPAAIRRLIDLRTEPGTLVDATWPAGMCKASTAAIPMVNTIATVTLGKMMATGADEELASRAMAPWMVAATVQDLFGEDRDGRSFGATMLDPMAGGGGAKAADDGVDGGGIIRAVKLRTANAETYEFRYPLLYLHRRLQPDTGGAGTNRGGVGCSLLFTLHGVDELPGNVMHSINTQAPTSVGILGGYPAGTNSMAMLRGTNVWDEIAAGRWPTELAEIEGTLEVVPGMLASTFSHGDVYRSITCGGGGFGDPLERALERVAHDVALHAVSPAEAKATYGVVLGADGAADVPATKSHRAELRAARLAGAVAPRLVPAADGKAKRLGAIGGSLTLYDCGEALPYVGCECGRLFSRAGDNYKHGLAVSEEPLQAAGPTANPYRVGQAFAFRRLFCPGCARLVEIEIARPDEPLLHDIDVRSVAAPAKGWDS